jgi:mxaJ protein
MSPTSSVRAWLSLLALAVAMPASARTLRVCADPNNLPFSNAKGEGFENKLAELFARELDAELAYVWIPQRRGFLRRTLKAELCDVVMGIPASVDMVATTRPYYRASYAFVVKPGARRIRSLADPALRTLRIGVPLVGDDGANPPPVHALSDRGIVDNVVGYSVIGDYAQPNPPSQVVEAVRRGEVDVAIAWGPVAGYFARTSLPALEVTPLLDREAPPGLPFSFEIAVGLRHKDRALRAELDGVLRRRRPEIHALLARYGVVHPRGGTP